MTVTEKLDEYRRLRLQSQGYSQTAIAKLIDPTRAPLSQSRMSQFAAFWNAVDNELLDSQLIRVIRVHSNLPERRGRKVNLFTLDKIASNRSNPDGLQLRLHKQPLVRFTRQQQAEALKETFEEAKRKWRIVRKVQTIEECTDDELIQFSYEKFIECLRNQVKRERDAD
jgi:hypothetical protein